MSTESDTIQMQAALTANKLASAAIGLAIAAMLLAYTQLLLGSDMTSNALWKTNRAAIGVMAQHRRMIPSFRRVKVLYPRISLKVEDLARAAYMSTPDYRAPKFLRRFARDRGLRWETDGRPEARSVHLAVAAKLNQLSDGWTPVSVGDLPFFIRLQYQVWHRFAYQERPRATWAQILEAFSISDGLTLLEGQLDSDSIPATIDVPVQRVRLTDLGNLALVLGCSSVELSVESRSFKATGPRCIFTTEDISNFWKGIYVFDKNHDRSLAAATTLSNALPIGRESFKQLFEEANSFIVEATTREECFLIPGREKLDVIAGSFGCIDGFCFNEGVLAGDGRRSEGVRTLHGSHPIESALGGDTVTVSLSRIPKESLLARWQHTRNRTIPNVLLTATTRPLPGMFIGFPASTYLRDMEAWCAMEIRYLLELNEKLFSQDKGVFREVDLHQRRVQIGLVDYAYSNESVRFGERPTYTWCSSEVHHVFQVLAEYHSHYPRVVKPGEPNLFLGVAAILPEIKSLLDYFSPHSWALEAKSGIKSQFKRPMFKIVMLDKFNPLAIIWQQIILLDVSINLQLQNGGQVFVSSAKSDYRSFINKLHGTLVAINRSKWLKSCTDEADIPSTESAVPEEVDQSTRQPEARSPERNDGHNHVCEENKAVAAHDAPSNGLSNDLAPKPLLETPNGLPSVTTSAISGKAGEECGPTADYTEHTTSTSPTTKRFKDNEIERSDRVTSTCTPASATTASGATNCSGSIGMQHPSQPPSV